MNVYDYGDVVRVTGTYTDADGTAQDPTAVFFEFMDPSGNETEYEYGVDGELVKSSTGVYYADIDCDECGFWNYRHYSTGTGQASVEGKFRVRESEFD